MSFRGVGGYRAGDFRSFRKLRRAFRAGDMLDDMGSGIDTFNVPTDPTDESMGLDLSAPDSAPSTDFALPDFGGSVVPAGLGALGPYLGGKGGQLGQWLGGLAGPAGSAAGAGMGAVGSGISKHVRRLARKYLGGGGGGTHRRMNPGNFHALRRSMRRLQSFERAARRVYQFTHPARGKSHFKFHRKRRR